jgi:carboxyl-terminal processing protease
MRTRLALFLTFAGPALLSAAPLELQETARTPLNAQEATVYAQQLVGLVNQVASSYVRPISRHQLFFSALSGLYEAAGMTVPSELKAELQSKIKDLPSADELDADGLTRRMKDAESVMQLIARIREQVGNPPALQNRGLRVSLEAMIAQLDPYCAIVDERELRRSSGESIYHGLGIELESRNIAGPLVIKTVIVGSPAQRAGLRPGDQITHLDRKPVESLADSYIGLRLSGGQPEGESATSHVDLMVQSAAGLNPAARPEATTRRIRLERGEYRAETVFGFQRKPEQTWNHMIDVKQKIGYVRIGSLEHGTSTDLYQVLSDLQADEVRGVILDLRWSPGGFLNEAVCIAELFLEQGTLLPLKSQADLVADWVVQLFLTRGTIATVRGRRVQDEQMYRAKPTAPFVNVPMIVLINGETMGGAELIAASLADNQRAIVAGQRSFGKASVQTVLPLPFADMGMKMTTGSFIRPNGKALHRFPDSKPADDWGVKPEPNLEVRLSTDLSLQLRDWYLLQSLRPGDSDDILPLDDPEKDPQRQRALMAMREMLEK